MPKPSPDPMVLSVSQLNAEVRKALDEGFPLLWVEGEVSNFARPASGHWYLTLKDERSQVRCAMFRQKNRLVSFQPENGDRVLVRARISLYEARGDYQLILETLESAGDGALRQAFEQLRRKLQAEGLFDPILKRPVPTWPASIGVITSASGAALRDILSVLRRRFPGVTVILYSSIVQGAEAPEQLVAALKTAERRHECDCLILARGGGSLEDLMAFNDEALARAIHACTLPVIAGIGHEIDITIADLVADLRAPTPTAAAELATPDRTAWQKHLITLGERLVRTSTLKLDSESEKLRNLAKRLRQSHPGRQLEQRVLRIDEFERRLVRSVAHQRERLGNAVAMLARALHAVSPLATLGRGYAIVRRQPEGDLVKRVADLRPSDNIEAQLVDGRFSAYVRSVTSEKSKK
ncbi:MAG: exodeoxyribonuclease VII large subunit [Gammaproteobacteria bacterium]